MCGLEQIASSRAAKSEESADVETEAEQGGGVKAEAGPREAVTLVWLADDIQFRVYSPGTGHEVAPLFGGARMQKPPKSRIASHLSLL